MTPLMRHPLAAILCLCTLATATSAPAAHLLHLRDGTTRRGVIEAQNSVELRLRMEVDGIRASVIIPKAQVHRVENVPDPVKQDAPSATTAGPAPSVFPTPAPAPRAGPYDALLARTQLPENAPAPSAGGTVPPAQAAPVPSAETLAELPAPLRDLWIGAVRAEALGDPAGTLEALKILEGNADVLPSGPIRLDEFCRKHRGEGFGTWMGRVRWGLLKDRYRAGVYDLRDVREPERPVLINALRENTAAALDPLRSYFPQIDPKTGLPEPFKRKHLEGITASNAIELKQQAAFASAVLQGQLKLEPTMPPADRALLATQLSTVSRILARARDLEPAARMALQRQELERKRAEARAKRDDQRARARIAMGTR